MVRPIWKTDQPLIFGHMPKILYLCALYIEFLVNLKVHVFVFVTMHYMHY